MVGIYSIKNNLNGKIYIGQSLDISTRFSRHKSDLKYNRHHNKHIQAAFNKYGGDVFSYEVLKECTEEQLDDLERKFILEFNSRDNGYNKETGGNSGKHLSDDTKIKISKSHLGKLISQETRQRLSSSLKGRPSPMKGRVSKMKGKKSTGYVPSFAGKHHSEKTKTLLSSKSKGVLKSEETRKRMSEARKKVWLSDDYRIKQSNSQIGKIHNKRRLDE